MLKDTRPSLEWWEYRVAPLWDCVGRVGDVLGKTRGRETFRRRGRQAESLFPIKPISIDCLYRQGDIGREGVNIMEEGQQQGAGRGLGDMRLGVGDMRFGGWGGWRGGDIGVGNGYIMSR